MIDLGPMESILNGAAIAEANAARTAAEEARSALAGKTGAAVTPLAMEATVPVAAEAPICEELTPEGRQGLLRLAYIASLGVLTPSQFDSVRNRLAAADGQVEAPNGAGGTGWNLAF